MEKNNDESAKLYNDSVCHTLNQKLNRLFHWAPIIALFIIFYIAAICTNCIAHIYHPFSNIYSFFHFSVYIYEFYLVLNNYLTASFLGPGFVPFGWTPKDSTDKQYLQFCELCDCYKPPRSHHCRKCDRCVLKMDHHCPWINTCCGHLNHGYFVYFLYFAPIGCLHSTYLIFLTLYYAVFIDFYINVDYGKIVMLSLWEFLFAFFAFGLAIGVVIAVGSLWVIQIKSILKNETAVETWICTKSQLRDKSENEAPFVYPYNLGKWNNLRQVITWKGRCQGDGVVWPVKSGCSQYDLTVEQLKQKKDKDTHSQMFIVKREYNGSLLPIWSVGCRAVCASPCTDEARLAVKLGYEIKVTRWRKHWLYGQIMYPAIVMKDGQKRRGKPRGWIPRICMRQMSYDNDKHHQYQPIVNNHGDVGHTTETLLNNSINTHDKVD